MASEKLTLSIAASAAVLAMSMAVPASAAYGSHSDQQVPCYGINDCKGQGFKDLSKKECAAAGGSLKAPK